LALILFLGLALAPRAFEFRAWPEQSRQYATEQVVDRPRAEVVEVAGVRESSRRPERAREATRERAGRDAVRVDERRAERRPPRGAPSRRGDRRAPTAPAPGTPDVVIETPAPAPPEPAPVAPEAPAQLAEVPPSDQVLRPDVPEVPPTAPAEPGFEVVDLSSGAPDVDGRKACGRPRQRGEGDGPRGR
jgi:hypothetical protein